MLVGVGVAALAAAGVLLWLGRFDHPDDGGRVVKARLVALSALLLAAACNLLVDNDAPVHDAIEGGAPDVDRADPTLLGVTHPAAPYCAAIRIDDDSIYFVGPTGRSLMKSDKEYHCPGFSQCPQVLADETLVASPQHIVVDGSDVLWGNNTDAASFAWGVDGSNPPCSRPRSAASMASALLLRSAFPALRDGGVFVPVRGWDGSATERGIEVRPVFVTEALERTTGSSNFAISPRAERSDRASPPSIRSDVSPTRSARWLPAAFADARW